MTKKKLPVAPSRATSSKARSGGSKKKKSGGGGKSPNAYARAAEKRAIARENKMRAKAAERYKYEAKTLEVQADALKKALNGGFKKALDTRLTNARRAFQQSDKALAEGYETRVESLEQGADENEAAAADSTFANLGNRARERAAAVSEAMSQGAGESDVLRAQMMSLRSWQANQGEVNRSFFDSLQSINSSLTDLTVDTKTARLNAESQYNSDQDQLWTEYFNRRSEAFTQLGNVQGQQANLYAQANEMKSSGSSKSSMKKYQSASGKSFDAASKEASQAWKNPGNSQALMEWEGREKFRGTNNTALLAETGPAIPAPKKPEGSSLRAWG
jgi:hypothetical protein